MPHIHEKIDYTADVYVVHKNRVLIRKHDKYGFWLAVGGHIELDETPDKAAIREVKEEVGLDITLLEPRERKYFKKDDYEDLTAPWFLNTHRINDIHWHIGMVFFAISKTDKVVPEKTTDEWRWLTKEELEQNVLQMEEEDLFYAKEALKAATGKG